MHSRWSGRHRYHHLCYRERGLPLGLGAADVGRHPRPRFQEESTLCRSTDGAALRRPRRRHLFRQRRRLPVGHGPDHVARRPDPLISCVREETTPYWVVFLWPKPVLLPASANIPGYSCWYPRSLLQTAVSEPVPLFVPVLSQESPSRPYR